MSTNLYSSSSSAIPTNDLQNVITYSKPFGGGLKRVKLEDEDDGFVAAQGVPTFATIPTPTTTTQYNHHHPNIHFQKDDATTCTTDQSPKRLGLEGLIPGAFIVENVLSSTTCREMISTCEYDLGFGHFNAGKNHHGAMQILVSKDVVQAIHEKISPFVDLEFVNQLTADTEAAVQRISQHNNNLNGKEMTQYGIVGLNRRWRVYRYEPGGVENFAPHIDAGFPPSTLSSDGSTLIWDATSPSSDHSVAVPEYNTDVVSRLTVLMYLNDDFEGGHTKFYTPRESNDNPSTVLAAVKPRAGSVLIFPQSVGEHIVEYARAHWPLHEGSPVLSGSSPKYVIRSDMLFGTARKGLSREELNNPLWKYEEHVRQTFLPKSRVWNPLFLNHVSNTYEACMGVENVGPLLYSFVRFTKVRNIVEIGSGYTSLWLLQALKDNDDEMQRIHHSHDEGTCRLLDIDWSIPPVLDQYHTDASSLLCIDNCQHEHETATSVNAIAKTLGLQSYFFSVKGDIFKMNFQSQAIDMLWCDFGVGSRMQEFLSKSWDAIRPGAFLICHSTVTNSHTREWLNAIRSRAGKDVTGINPDEYVELSLLEEHKKYQNSITILQKRKTSNGSYDEPIYSEYA